MIPLAQTPDFATTHWSVVLIAGGTANPAAHAALDTLFRTYWKPLYSYARRRGQTHHDAEDLIQAFFHRLLQKDAFREASQQRGRFRSFLLASLKNFITNEHDRVTALKRGGGQTHISFADGALGEMMASEVGADDKPPEWLFDREWARTIFSNAMRRLEQEFKDDGKQTQFTALAPFLSQPPEAGDYERLAAQLGIRPGLMPTVVSRLRQRYRELARAEIAATVATPAEVDAELRYLVELMTS